MRLAIVGSWEGFTKEYVFEKLDLFLEDNKPDVIISGGASGVDSYARAWADTNKIDQIIHLAKWDEHGKKAGILRNYDIIDDCDMVFAFWDGKSPGTSHSISYAMKIGKPLKIFSKPNKTTL